MRLFVAVGSLLFLVSAALADVELVVAPGDKITGTLDPAAEVERFLAPLPQGALVTVKAKTAKGGPQLRVRVLPPVGAAIADETGTKPSIAKLAVPATGVYAIEVTSSNGATGSYALAVTWTAPKSAAASAVVPAAGEGQIVFAAAAGTIVKYALKPSRGSPAAAEALRIDGTNLFTVALPAAATGQTALPSLGDYTLRFRNGAGTAGGIDAAVKLSVPKTAKRKIDLSSRTVTPGARIVAAAIVTAAGGTLASPGGPTAGASVTFPPGAVAKKPVLATLGEGAPIATPANEYEIAAGPAVYLGPEGATWQGGVTVTLPYDPLALPAGTNGLHLQTRDAAGAISDITGFNVDGAAHTVTFTTTHFSTFQLVATAAKQATLRARLASAAPEDSNDNFGFAVGISDTWIAAGATGTNTNGESDAGAVTVYPFANGVVGAGERIQAPVPERNDHFGTSVAVGSDFVVVGAQGQASQSQTPGGSAFVYRRTGNAWVHEQELTSDLPSPGGSFGVRMALHGTRVVVAAYGESNGQVSSAGAAYVFAYDGTNWVREARLVSSTPRGGDTFGLSVAIHGDTVAVGSFDAQATERSAGDVTVFQRNPGTGVWSEVQNLKPPQPQRFDFGGSVALGDGRLVCGCSTGESVFISEGSAFAYSGAPGSFALEDTLTGAGPLNGQFGFSCAIDGDRMLVGALGQFVDGAPGKVYSFERKDDAWKREATMRGGDVDLPAGSFLGFSVALRGKYFLMGAPKAPGGANAEFGSGGAAFLFELDE